MGRGRQQAGVDAGGSDLTTALHSARLSSPVRRPEKETIQLHDSSDVAPLTNNGAHVEISAIPFGTTDWSTVERTEHRGERGSASWRTRHVGSIRVRMVDYTPGYIADHWCSKGHILLCIEGTLVTELEDGRRFTLGPGMSYEVGDNAEPHRSSTDTGARLFIVD
jgi:hypothetical protein